MTSEKTANRAFLLRELITRDFVKKYKRTSLGILWSALSPLLLLITMDLVFGTFFGRNMPHYTIYLFAGLLLFNYFSTSTRSAMNVLYNNSGIYSKVPVPKSYFLISHSAAHFIDFLISLLVFFVFVAIDGIAFRFDFLLLVYPIVCLYFINLGVGMFLSCVSIFFRDINHVWPVVCRIIMYASAIFYDTGILPAVMQRMLLCNPLYMCISYFRQLIIDACIPDVGFHAALALMAAFCMLLGAGTYRMCRDKIALYV